MIRSLTAISAMLLLTLTIAIAALSTKSQHTNPHPYALVAVVFQDGSPAQTFTFQGVFSDPQTGNPINGPDNIRIGIADGPADSDPILTLTEAQPDYTNGRFTTDVDLLDPQIMLDITDPHIVILSADGNDTPLIPRIPLSYTPYAWTAEHAREATLAHEAIVAREADVAQDAATADLATRALTADTADTITSTTVDIPITGDNWVSSGFSPPTATRRGDLIYLSGIAFRGTPASSDFAQLPEGFRPAIEKRILTGYASNTQPISVEVRIDPDGTVRIQNSVNGGSISLDGIVFQAAP